jgi:hypothetical protein
MVVESYRQRIEFEISELARLLCFAGHLMHGFIDRLA